MWNEYIREKRLTNGISLRKLSLATDISPAYLSQIENGKKKPSEQLKRKLESILNFEIAKNSPEAVLEIVVDYVRIRFPTKDVRYIIERVLRIQQKYMVHEDYAFYGYTDHYRIGDIIVMSSADTDKQRGVLLELKGRGSRQFECYLKAQRRTWRDFLTQCMDNNCYFKRIDLAINDRFGILSIAELVHKCDNQQYISIFKTFRNYRSGELSLKDQKMGMGETLYIGSLKSDIYFCVYEKDYEQYDKKGVSIQDADIKNRFEVRLKNQRAEMAISDYLEFNDIEKTVFEIINRYVTFLDEDKNKTRDKWKINKQWAYFMGEERSKLRLTTNPEPYNVDRTYAWLSKQVAPTLKMLDKADQMNGTETIRHLLDNSKLRDKHQKLLQQLTSNVEDIII